MKPAKKTPLKMRNEEQNEPKGERRKEAKMSPKQLAQYEVAEMKGKKVARKK